VALFLCPEKGDLKRVGRDKDVQIWQGKNLLGISYDVDLTNVATRIMPTGEDENGELLYLPELYIDSQHIDGFVKPKWLHLPVADAKEMTKGDERKTKEECYAEMRKAVQTAYDSGCDLPTVTLKVDFINCADTVEYNQYKALQNIFLGDSVRVIARRIGVEVSMRMTQYTYICGEIISFDEGPPQLPQYAAEADQLGGYFPAKLFVISRNLHQLPANCTFKISSALLRDCLHYYTIAGESCNNAEADQTQIRRKTENGLPGEELCANIA